MVKYLRGRFRGEEAGFTLIEMIVTMVVFSIFLSITLASVIGVTHASSRAQLLAKSSSSILTVFQTFDRQLRYANSINFPGAGPSGARYVEFRTGSDSASSGVSSCTQWRLDPTNKVMQSRQWQEGAVAPAFVTKISAVVDLGGAGYPFKLVPATIGGSTMQQLVLSISSGTNTAVTGAAISTTFVARNSSILSPSNSNAVVPGTSDTPVCTYPGSRP